MHSKSHQFLTISCATRRKTSSYTQLHRMKAGICLAIKGNDSLNVYIKWNRVVKQTLNSPLRSCKGACTNQTQGYGIKL